MKAVLFALGVLGLAAVFAVSEPTAVSARPVTSDDVRVVSEQMPDKASSQVTARTRASYNRGNRGSRIQIR
jgi:hypothetical protein